MAGSGEAGGGLSSAPLSGVLPQCGPDHPAVRKMDDVSPSSFPRAFTEAQWDQVKQNTVRNIDASRKGANMPPGGSISERDLVGSVASSIGVPVGSLVGAIRSDKSVSAAVEVGKAAAGELNAGAPPAHRRVVQPGESCVIPDPLVSSASPRAGFSDVLSAWGQLASPGAQMMQAGPSLSRGRGFGIGLG